MLARNFDVHVAKVAARMGINNRMVVLVRLKSVRVP